MAQIQCPKGHFYNNEIYKEGCPYCADGFSKFEDNNGGDNSGNPDNYSNNINRVAQILSAFAIVMAVVSLFMINANKRELADIEQKNSEKHAELQKIIQESEKEGTIIYSAKFFTNEILNPIYGRAADNFYADSPVVILEADGSPKFLNISSDFSSRFFIELHKTLTEDFTDGWCKDINAEWIESGKVKITPGSTAGYNIIHFFSKENNLSFDILVIVR